MEDLEINKDNEVQINNEIQETKQLGFMQRLTGVITSPAETMRAIAEKPRILFPMLIIALGLLLLYAVRYPVYEKDTVDATMRLYEVMNERQNMQIPQEIMENNAAAAAKQGLISAPITSLVFWFLGSTILLILVRIFKGKIKFKQVLSITGYAYVVMLIYLLIVMLTSFFTGTLKMDTSLALFAGQMIPFEAGKFGFGFMYGILKSIEVFSLWQYVLIAIGIREATKISNKRIYIIMSIVVLGAMLFAALTSGITEMMTGAVSASIF